MPLGMKREIRSKFGLEEFEGNEKKGISRLVIEGHRREKVYLIQSKVIA